jgi:hypothetical protein
VKHLQVVKKSKEKKTEKQSPAQKTFSSLKRKLENQRRESQEVQQELDHCLLYYEDKILPTKKMLVDSIKTFVPLVYQHYKNKKSWTLIQRREMKEIILDDMRQLFQWTARDDLGDEILTIFEDVNGVAYDKIACDEVDAMKEELRGLFKHQAGVDVDFSSIKGTDAESEILRKVAEALDSVAEEMKDKFEETACETKSKKQLDKERKLQEIEERQKQGIGSLYKRLAKAFHPDLESDESKKIEKEKCMKRITQAYEESDIHTLLLLEMEWLDRSTLDGATYGDDQVKVYNSLLKNQIEELREEIRMLAIRPKYMPLSEYVTDPGFSGMETLEEHYISLQTKLTEYQDTIEDLQGPNAKKTIPVLIKRANFERMQREFLDLFGDGDGDEDDDDFDEYDFW